MNAFKLLVTDLGKLTSKKGMLLSVILVLLVPIVYVAILLSSTWGPYDYMSNLPVAVVNKDKGAMSGDELINIGEELVADMKQSMTLGFHFVNEESAQQGLTNQDYYMVIEIPEDFSQKITTVLTESPKVPELRYYQNEGLNFTAAQVTSGATEKIREQLGNKITEIYTQSLFAQLGEISSGFESAAEGSDQLYSGSIELREGTGSILSALQQKAPEINALAAGSQELEAGTQELLTSLISKQGSIEELASGSKDLEAAIGLLLTTIQQGSEQIDVLAEGGEKLANGSQELAKYTPQILQGLNDAYNGSVSLNSGMELLAPGSQEVANGINGIITGTNDLAENMQTLLTLLEAYNATHNLNSDENFTTILALSNGISAGVNQLMNDTQSKLKPGADLVAQGLDEAAPSVKQLEAGLGELIIGQEAVNNGVLELDTGAKQIADGTAIVSSSWNSIINNLSSIHSGASMVRIGNNDVNTGWKTLTEGTTIINSNMQLLNEGNQSVQSGWGDLTNGVLQLDAGAGQIEEGSMELALGLEEGAQQTTSINTSDKNIAMFSSPVQLVEEKVSGFEYYRDSTAPYIISLALFVGILMMSFIIDFKKPSEPELPTSAISLFASKFMTLTLFSVVQGLLVSVVTILFLQLNVANVVSFILFTISVSLTFMTIIFFLVSLAGNVGRFLAFVFIVLQLSITGANLPIDMLPENLRNLSEFLPLTYTNAGFKAIISLNDTGFMWSNTSVLLIYFVIFSMLALSTFLFGTKKLAHDQSLSA
ncbi:YhgE/Pip domain-containing protein [Bacillus sp. SM2101]|uniref:YhgE/Pip domain-containing protein n=1 Tax=Bacillus sp. SM2101 TaxID=2805366 RepID=UPI001BDDE907|nr:YhgE/Pip domain-containing protein [Bacillus sp. SM2101]